VGTVVQNDRETVTKRYVPDYAGAAMRDAFVVEDGSFEQSCVYDGMSPAPALLSLEYAFETERDSRDLPGTNPASDIAKNVTVKAWHHGSRILGSKLYASDGDGEIRMHMIYDEWGLPQMETRLDMNYAGLDNINSYTGYTYDEVLDIYCAQARFYDPKARRFMQEDPAKGGWNRYAYAWNNPVTGTDPQGLFARPAGAPAPQRASWLLQEFVHGGGVVLAHGLRDGEDPEPQLRLP
jgi:RHS repeat-associated protein